MKSTIGSETIGSQNIGSQTAGDRQSSTLAGRISTQERELLVELLERSREAFLACVAAVPSSQWHAHPRVDAWSIHECVEHVVISERSLRDLVTDTILGAAPAPERAAATQGKDGLVIQAMRDRSHGRKTFDFLEPTGRWPDRDTLVERFQDERARTLGYVRTTQEALHHHVAPLDPLGDLDAYQWLLLLASHTERHIAQVQAVGAALRT